MKPNLIAITLMVALFSAPALKAQPLMITSSGGGGVFARPHIILIASDGRDSVSSQLDARGTVFTNAYAVFPNKRTDKILMLTGSYIGLFLSSPPMNNLQTYLHHNGYYTVIIGSQKMLPRLGEWDVIRNEYPDADRPYNRAPGATRRAVASDLAAATLNGSPLFLFLNDANEQAVNDVLLAIDDSGMQSQTLIIRVTLPDIHKELTSVPLAFRTSITAVWPGRIAQGATNSTSTLSIQDIAPTINDAVYALPPMPGMDGISFFNLLMGIDKQGVREGARLELADHNDRTTIITDGNYCYMQEKIITSNKKRNPTTITVEKLFNLNKDPKCTTDIAADTPDLLTKYRYIFSKM